MEETITLAEFKEMFADIHEMQRKSELEHQRRREEVDREMAELRAAQREINRKLKSYGFVQGEVAEDLFRRNARELLRRVGIDIHEVVTNLKRTGGREYDIVASNDNEAVVIEVKHKLRRPDIDKFVNVQLPQFKENFPELSGFTIYGSIGALVVKRELEREALKNGLYVFCQGENDIALLRSPDESLRRTF